MTMIRRDPITGERVIYPVGRSARPSDLHVNPVGTVSSAGTCPFCEGAESQTPPEVYSLVRNGRWVTRVFPNKFPILSLDGTGQENDRILKSEFGDWLHHGQVQGCHEIIVDHPDHEMTFFTMSQQEMFDLLLTYRERYRVHVDGNGGLEKAAYILIFKNHGKQAGASLYHPHSQLTVLPFVPPRVQMEIDEYSQYAEQHGKCIFCELLTGEVGGEREIIHTDDYLVIAPFASRFRFESWVLPQKHQAHFGELSEGDVEGLARVLVELFARYQRVCGDMPFNMYIHTGPIAADGENIDFHWHIEIVPRLGVLAGFELGGGLFVNTMLPEDVAEILRRGDVR